MRAVRLGAEVVLGRIILHRRSRTRATDCEQPVEHRSMTVTDRPGPQATGIIRPVSNPRAGRRDEYGGRAGYVVSLNPTYWEEGMWQQ